MKTTLEIFYLRIVGKSVRYRRKEVSLSRKGSDPDQLIWSHIRQEHRNHTQDASHEHEFIIHSTSWRYEQPGKILLTYVAYSDKLEFEKGNAKNLRLKHLQTITRNARKPRSRAEREKKVVSHAMRHIAFLVQTDDQIDFESAMTPETRQIFERLWITLAGRVFGKNE